MTDTKSDSPSQRTLTRRRWLPSAIIFGLLLLNAILLFIPGNQLPEGVRVFFWQRYNGYLYLLQFLILVLVPIATIINSIFLFKQVRSWWFVGELLAIVFSFVFCLFANYSSLFISGYLDSIGTVNSNQHVYHLVRYGKYDDPSQYYFGKCDQSGYWCVFQEICNSFLYEPESPQITVSNNPYLVIVKMGSEIVYTFDGKVNHNYLEDGSCPYPYYP